MDKKNLDLKIIELNEEHIPDIIQFADKNIGRRYYSADSLKAILKASRKNGPSTSLGMWLEPEGKLVAIRISLPPGTWMENFCQGHLSDKWDFPPEKAAYFKSLFVGPGFRGQRIGPRLSKETLRRLKAQGASAVVTHSWKESPENSSGKYLKRLGFVPVGDLTNYWAKVDYDCVGCGRKPCDCTAVEMALKID